MIFVLAFLFFIYVYLYKGDKHVKENLFYNLKLTPLIVIRNIIGPFVGYLAVGVIISFCLGMLIWDAADFSDAEVVGEKSIYNFSEADPSFSKENLFVLEERHKDSYYCMVYTWNDKYSMYVAEYSKRDTVTIRYSNDQTPMIATIRQTKKLPKALYYIFIIADIPEVTDQYRYEIIVPHDSVYVLN